MDEISVEFLLVEERGAVKALEHLAIDAAFPVRAGDRQELKSADLPRPRNVRSAAEVDEFALAIKAQNAVLMQFLVDMFDFIRLPQVEAKFTSFRHGQGEAFERFVELEDLGHFGFDRRKVVFGEGTFAKIDVVIEAGRSGRTEGEFRAFEEAEDGAGHDVGGRVPQDVERLAIARGEQAQFDRAVRGFERPVEIDDRAVGDGGDRGFGQALADRLGDLRGRTPSGKSLIEPSGSLIAIIVLDTSFGGRKILN